MSDVEILYLWENDRKSWHVSHTVAPFSRHVLTDYIHSVSDIYTDKQLRLIIERKQDYKALGALDLFDFDFKNHRAGIGILIADEENRRQGLASSAIKIIEHYAFKTLRLHQLYCNIDPQNHPSVALFQGCGFKIIGTKEAWIYSNGAFHDELILQKLNEETKEAEG